MLLTMNRLIFSLLLFLVVTVPACTPAPVQYTQLESQSIHADGEQSVVIQVDYGEVTILESADTQVYIDGQVLFDQKMEYQLNSNEEQIHIKIFTNRDSSTKPPLQVTVRVPKHMQVMVETNNASVAVKSYQGDVDVSSVSGDITLEHVNGNASLRSNRGKVTARESSGRLGIVGNYGPLTARDVRGDVSISTIMGDVSLEGAIAEGDEFRLETDHGAVSVKLSEGSSLTLKVGSTSGNVACMLPGITSTPRTCAGELGSGAGSLWIRTVSGAVTLQTMP